MTLDKDLSNIGHQSTSITQGIPFFDPPSDHLLVLLVLINCPEVTGTEHFRLLLYQQVFV